MGKNSVVRLTSMQFWHLSLSFFFFFYIFRNIFVGHFLNKFSESPWRAMLTVIWKIIRQIVTVQIFCIVTICFLFWCCVSNPSWFSSCAVLVAQLYPTVCNPMDYSPPGSSVCWFLQARILEWVAIPFSRRSSQPRDLTPVSWVSCIGGWVLYH